MKKTVNIDLSSDRLISMAAELVDDHKYISALKMLNKNAELSGNDMDSYMLYAEIFDDMGLYAKSVNNWFRFLDCADYEDLSDCFEGLAVNYMNLGNNHFSAYYYNRLLMETEEVDPDSREEIIRSFLGEDENPLKIAYPPEKADCTGIIADGIAKLKSGEYDAAISEFDKVDERNESYLAARNYVAMCQIIADRNEEAEQECLHILEKYPDNVQALTTLAAVKNEMGYRDQSVEIVKKLISVETQSPEELYKIATVCCENKLHEQAYEIFNKLSGEGLTYDLSVLFFKAVSAFNCGKYQDSFDVFDTLLTIYPAAVTADYYYNEARKMHGRGEEREMAYFYRMPKDQRESSLAMLAAFARLPQNSAAKLTAELDITECVLWTFDEMEGNHGIEVKSLAAQVAVKAGMDDIVREILLDAFQPDEIKIETLTALAERNRENVFGVVICHLYKRVTMRKIQTDKLKRVYFVRAYAQLVAHFSIIDDLNGEKFALAAERLYAALRDGDRLDYAKDVSALAAAIYIISGVSEVGVTDITAAAFFGADQKKIDRLLEKL